MKINPHIFREYDIRGIAEVDYDAEFVEALGRAYGTRMVSRGIDKVAVGRDHRVTSEGYAEALKRGIRSTGTHVVVCV